MGPIAVLISIHANAHRDQDTEEPMSMLVSGTMELEMDRAVIRYEENLDESLPPQPVTITVCDDSVTMERTGAYETGMHFTQGQRFEGVYHTPYGDMDLATYCTRLRCKLDEEGGDLLLSYQLDLNGQFAAMHEMEMHVFVQNEQAD